MLTRNKVQSFHFGSVYVLLVFVCFVILYTFFADGRCFFNFSKKYFRYTSQSNKTDLDQAWHIVHPDLCLNCLQILSADEISRQTAVPTIARNIWTSNYNNDILTYQNTSHNAGPRSAVGNVSGYRCVSDCRSRGREFDPGPVPYFRGD